MSKGTVGANGWPLMDRYESPRKLAYAVAVTLSLGLAGGFLTFAFDNPKLLPPAIEADWVLVGIGVLGVYASVLAGQLDRSMATVLGASGVSFVVHVVAWMWPLGMLVGDAPLAGIAYVAVYGPLGEAILGWLFVFPLAFLGGFLTYILLTGYFHS